MSELNGNGALGKTRTFISAALLLLAVCGVVYASGRLAGRVETAESRILNTEKSLQQLDDKKADKRELDDIHKQLDRIEGKLDRRR